MCIGDQPIIYDKDGNEINIIIEKPTLDDFKDVEKPDGV